MKITSDYKLQICELHVYDLQAKQCVSFEQ